MVLHLPTSERNSLSKGDSFRGSRMPPTIAVVGSGIKIVPAIERFLKRLPGSAEDAWWYCTSMHHACLFLQSNITKKPRFQMFFGEQLLSTCWQVVCRTVDTETGWKVLKDGCDWGKSESYYFPLLVPLGSQESNRYNIRIEVTLLLYATPYNSN